MADPDRNLPASARKIRRARESGQVPRSRDLGHFMAIGMVATVLIVAMPTVTHHAQVLVAEGLSFDRATALSPEVAAAHTMHLLSRGLAGVLLFGLLIMASGVAGNLGLGGWNFSLKAIQPDLTRLNPIAGLGRLFNAQHLIVTAKAILLAIAVGLTGGLYLHNHFDTFGSVLMYALPEGLSKVGDTIGTGLMMMLGVLAAWTLIDVPLQRKQYLDRLKMTRQEVKQEAKESLGPQEVKQKIKQKMRQLARRRMMKAVPTADVVVTNPTHYAVALKYDQSAMGAPRVVAKGTDRVAARIRDLARDAGVPLLEAPPLARALHAHVEIDGEVPAALFAAVAQVLAWVYQLRRNSRLVPPAVHVPPELDPLQGGTRGARRRAVVAQRQAGA